MDWNDIDNIIFDGTEEEINAVRCPECGEKLKMSYTHSTKGYEIKCGCSLIKAHGAPYVPNFALFSKDTTDTVIFPFHEIDKIDEIDKRDRKSRINNRGIRPV